MVYDSIDIVCEFIPPTIALIGIGIILGQQLFGFVFTLFPDTAQESFGKVWEYIYQLSQGTTMMGLIHRSWWHHRISFGTNRASVFIATTARSKQIPSLQIVSDDALGPIIVLVPYAERAKGMLTHTFVTICCVPIFYYLLHSLIIHISALVVNYIKSGNAHQAFH